MLHVINVVPTPEGWAVEIDDLDYAMAFLSGANAEAAARKLGARLSRAGQPSVISIYLRDGALAGRIRPGAAGLQQP